VQHPSLSATEQTGVAVSKQSIIVFCFLCSKSTKNDWFDKILLINKQNQNKKTLLLRKFILPKCANFLIN